MSQIFIFFFLQLDFQDFTKWKLGSKEKIWNIVPAKWPQLQVSQIKLINYV